MARDAPAEFLPLFHAAMARAQARPQLDAFIGSLSASEADACVGAYFNASIDPAYHYSRTDKRSLSVFAALAMAAIDQGEPLYAVRFDALVHAEKTPWRDRFTALEPGQQDKLMVRATQKQKALGRPQREVIRMLPDVIRTGRSGEMQEYVDKLDFREAHGCLLAYLEASFRYPADNGRSLQVFMGLSVLTIRKGDADFVKQYRTLIARPGTVWSLRWGALEKYLRDQVESELRSRPLKVQLVQAGKTEGKVPVSVVTPSPDRLRSDATRRDVAVPTNTTRTFIELFEAYMTPGGDAKAKKYKITEFILAQKLPGARECLAAYLEASTRYPADSQQSLYIFWGVASRLIHIGTAYEALKLDLLRNSPGTLVAQRFAALVETYRTKLQAEIAALIDPKTRRVLDDLKLEYYKRHRTDPDLASLRAFEVDVDPSYRDSVRGAARDCDRTYNQRYAKGFIDAFDAWTDLMHGQREPLVLVTMLKWCRELAEIAPALRSELYWYGVLALQIASLVRYPELYDRGLSDEEKEFFLHPSLVPQAYRYDFDRRMEFVFWKRARGADKKLDPYAPAPTVKPAQPSLQDVSRAHVTLLYLAQKLGFTLVAMDDAAQIREELLALKAEKSKTYDEILIPVSSRFPDTNLTLGASVGDLYIVWWNRKTNRAYVEKDGFGRVLFEVDSYLKLGRLKREDETYGKIWRDTQHLLVVIPLFYQILGYLPDLVSGGFAALVVDVLTDVAVDVFAEQAELGEKATMLLGFAAQLGSGHLLDRMRDSNGTRVLLDLDDLDELSNDIARGTMRQADISVAPRERMIDGQAKGLDTGTGGSPGSRALDDLDEIETHGITAARTDDASPSTRPHSEEHAGTTRDEEPHRGDDALDEPEREAGESSGALDDRHEGGSARKQRADPNEYNRFQGDSRAQPTGGSADAKARGKTEVKGGGGGGRSRGAAGRGGKPKQAPPYDLIEDDSHPLLQDLINEGWSFKKIPVKQPKSLGGAFQKSVGGDFEWRITAPSGEHFDADFLANNPHGGGILIGDAKATRMTDPDKSAHIVFWSDKAEALGRATALSLESDGRLTVELVCNVNEVAGSTTKSVVGPEVYTNVVQQQVAVELIERRGAALDRYYSQRNGAGYKPTREEVQRLVDRRVEVSDVDWGKIGSTKTPSTTGPARKGSGPRHK